MRSIVRGVIEDTADALYRLLYVEDYGRAVLLLLDLGLLYDNPARYNSG